MTPTPDFEAIAATSRHGTRARYKHGCRCDQCRAANATYQRQRRHALRQQDPTTTVAANRGGWAAPVVGIAVGLAGVWAVIRKAAPS